MGHCPAPGRHGVSKAWFKCRGSEVLSRWRFGALGKTGAAGDWFSGDELSTAKEKARAFLSKHYAPETMEQIESFSLDIARQRDIVICKVCQESMDSIGSKSMRRCDLLVDPWSWANEDEEARVHEKMA